MTAIVVSPASESKPVANQERKDATSYTRQAHSEASQSLPPDDHSDFEDARRGLIAPLPDVPVKSGTQIIWDPAKFNFLQEATIAPDTVNPGLWRQSRLVNISGLFKVTDRLYQVRNYDLANMTIIEGDRGIIVVDPLMSAETASAALDLYYRHRPRKPVLNVIYSHSHIDHYGGVKGVVSESDVKAGRIKIYAPQGFLEHAISENVLAGNAMSRRSSYMYGVLLPADAEGQVGAGLGMTTSSGTVTLIPPTDIIHGDEVKSIDGLTFEFMPAPDTEAPAEMHWFIPELKALTAAENCTHTLHNIYTLRGAKVRDPLAWSKCLQATITRWGSQAEVLYGMHHWPTWGNERIVEMMKKQRDLYRFINDQTLRLANQGYNMTEIAEMLQLPKSLASRWYDRGYYGSLNHDIKGTFVHYLGYFDGNPATLDELPPAEAGKRYVEYMGGSHAVLARARESFAKGDYRWVAMVLNHVIFAEPGNQEALRLQADCLEQLGYRCESGPWRNFYLSGAQELREGISSQDKRTSASPDTVQAMSVDMFFDFLGVRLDGQRAEGKTMTFNFEFPDTGQRYVLRLENSALNYVADYQAPDADASVRLNRSTFNDVILKRKTVTQGVIDGSIHITGSKDKLREFHKLFDDSAPWFPLVTPRAQ